MAFDGKAEKKSGRVDGVDRVDGAIAVALLDWYDANARTLPWRVGPRARRAGVAPDPYAVWLSEIMLQQTTVASVAPRYAEFLERWPDVGAMAAAPLDDVLGQWAGLGYYARARNLHKCALTIVAEHDGKFPDTQEALLALPGIGAYTAAAVAAIAFDRRAIVVDGNIERVVARLFEIETPLPAARPVIKIRAETIWPQMRSGDFAQGLMDLGATICRPKSPACLLCPLANNCASAKSGRAEELPRKAAKKPKPHRRGAVFAMTNSKGEMLFERRPEKGLLGGMAGLPGTVWRETPYTDVLSSAPAAAQWRPAGEVVHIFTHFQLTLDVFVADAPKGFRRKGDQQWVKPEVAQLPTVFAKAVRCAAALSSSVSPAGP